MKHNIKKLVLEYNRFMDDVLDNSDEMVFQDIIKSKMYHPKTNKELKEQIKELLNKGYTNFNIIDVSEIDDFSYVFPNLSLETLDLSGWDVSKGETFSDMFYGCKNLKELDITNWDVSNGTNFEHMFYDCKLLNMDISKWNTKSAHTFYGMFFNC